MTNHTRIMPIVACAPPIERPGENAAIWAIVAINLLLALATFCARFL